MLKISASYGALVNRDSTKTIWLLEDDAGARFVYQEILRPEYELVFFDSIASLIAEMQSNTPKPDLLIADLRLSNGSFIAVLESEEGRRLIDYPFVMVSSIGDPDALRKSFELGAADFLTKPFRTNELLVKVERIFKQRTKESTAVGDDFEIDLVTLRVKRSNQYSETLTPKELQLLMFLKQAPGRTLTRDELLTKVWGTVKVSPNTLDVHLFNLRRKISTTGITIQFLPPSTFQILVGK